MIRTILLLIGAAVVACLAASSTRAATTYVVAPAPAGDDANPGTDAAPFATIQHAASVAVAGDTIVVRAGQYVGAKFTTSGAPGAPIVVRGDDGAVVTSPGPLNTNSAGFWVYNASYVEIENFEVTSVAGCGIVVSSSTPPGQGPRGLVVRGNHVHGTSFGGIGVNGTYGALVVGNSVHDVVGQPGIGSIPSMDALVITGNVVRDCALGAIRIAGTAVGGDTAVAQATVDGNMCFGNGASGAATISLQGTRACLVVDNLVVGGHGRAIEVVGQVGGPGAVSNRVFSNTVVQAAGGGVPLAVLDRATLTSVVDNILLPPSGLGSIDTDASSASGFQSDHNDLFGPIRIDGVESSLEAWRMLGYDGASISAPAGELFVDVTANDYALRADAPAVDAGRPVSGGGVDIRGVARPQGAGFDIGAYEYAEPGPENHAPVASAGADARAVEGTTVTLDGSASVDSDGDTLAYMWRQTDGVAVELEGASTTSASFTAPAVQDTMSLTFELTVDDGRGGTSTDTVTITVDPMVPRITLVAPAAGDVWKPKSSKTIRWVPDAGVTGACRIELSRDGGASYEVLVASVDVQRGKRKWKVKGPRTQMAVIRIVLVVDERIAGVSAPFAIGRVSGRSDP